MIQRLLQQSRSKNCLIVYFVTISFTVCAQVPVINDFSPRNGRAGSTVTITGANFSPVPAQNSVFFGSARAQVNTATATQLTVRVPIGAAHRKISVTTGGRTGYSFQPFLPTSAGTEIAFNPRVDYPVNNNARFIDAGDFNNDGHLDLVVSNTDINSLSILPGDGSGALGTPINYTTGTGTHATFADFSGNGLLDLVVSNYSASSAASTSVLLNSGSFSFAPAAGYFLSPGPIGIGSGAVFSVEADFNLDGFLDVAFAIDNIPGTVSVLLNQGGGLFSPKTEYPVSNYPYSLAAGDFNKDGYPDLALAHFFTQTMGILLNNGAGGFLPVVTYPSGNGSHDIKVADFNKDGNLDLVLINALSNTVDVYINDGTGQFGTRTDYPSGTGYQASLVLADVNGDDRPDIVAGGGGSPSVFILLANTAGGFDPPTSLTVGNSPFSVAVGDFDEDGKPDIAAANSADNTVSLFLSKPPTTEIIVYNALSPDGDGKNDFLYIENVNLSADTRENSVTIYSRWGDEVWRGSNYDNEEVLFQGVSKSGKELPAGTYFYRISFANGTTKTGNLSIKR